VVHSLEEALERAGTAPELVVIGGAEVYRLALPRAQRIYLTRVHAEVAGDAIFPPLDETAWRETERQFHAADSRHAHAFTFRVLERVRAGLTPAR
jgi:dihydrofolate reductase